MVHVAFRNAFCVFATPLLVSACAVFNDPVVCTLEIRPGITVEVRDSITAAYAGAGARIVATDGAFADTAITTSADVAYGLADERGGTYTVTVEHAGYDLWKRDGVRVTEDECHARTVSLVARLQR